MAITTSCCAQWFSYNFISYKTQPIELLLSVNPAIARGRLSLFLGCLRLLPTCQLIANHTCLWLLRVKITFQTFFVVM